MNITTLGQLAYDLALLLAVAISYLILRDQVRILAIGLSEAKALIVYLNHRYSLAEERPKSGDGPEELIDRLNQWRLRAEERPKNRDGAEHDGGYRAPARTLLGNASRDESADQREVESVSDILSVWVVPGCRIIKSEGAYPWSVMYGRTEYSGTTPASAAIKLTLEQAWEAHKYAREAAMQAERTPSTAAVKDVSAKWTKLAYLLQAIDKLYEHIDADKRQEVSNTDEAEKKS